MVFVELYMIGSRTICLDDFSMFLLMVSILN